MKGRNAPLKRPQAKAAITFKAAPRKSKAARIAGVPAVRKEDKAVDTNSLVIASTNLDVILLNGVQNGDEGYERVGRLLEAKSIHFKFGFVPRSTTNSVDFVRVALVWDRDPSGVTPLYSEIFRSVDSAGTATSNNESFKNLDTKHRFTILRDRTVNLPGYTDTAGVLTNIQPSRPKDEEWHTDWFIDLKGLQSRYSGITFGIASLEQGGLFFVVAGGYSAGTAPWSVNYSSRFSYTDD